MTAELEAGVGERPPSGKPSPVPDPQGSGRASEEGQAK